MEGLAKWTQRDEPTTSNRELEAKKAASAPVGSLMFMEVERRIDVFLFRSCFATSAYQARQLVVHGKVTLNGEKVILLDL
jgi:ribosomal protein S4